MATALFQVGFYIILLCSVVQGLQQQPSLLTNTKWKLRLDVGLQPGTWMPKRFPGWAESGARLGLEVQVEFNDKPCSSNIREALVGPKDDTYQLRVTSPRSTFVSERGEEQVEFTTGGWCLQRPTSPMKSGGRGLVKPEGLLRFWLDCPSGAKRRDVEIFPGTRIFFTTGVWDDPGAVRVKDAEYRKVLDQLQELADKTRETREKSQDQNILQNLLAFRQLVGNSKEFDELIDYKNLYEQELPPTGAIVASNGLQMAPTGSLVIKGNQTPDWLPGSEYLILGTFSISAVDSDS
jgi:hypothetical protein